MEPLDVSLRALLPDDAEMVRRWRNSNAVASGMITNHTITVAEHEAWLDRVLRSDECHYWVICAGGEPVGLAYVYDIDGALRQCSWGFYNADVQLRGRGIVVAALTMVLDFVFGELGINVVNADVLKDNDASLAVHRRLGFHVTDGRAVGPVALRLEAKDWQDGHD